MNQTAPNGSAEDCLALIGYARQSDSIPWAEMSKMLSIPLLIPVSIPVSIWQALAAPVGAGFGAGSAPLLLFLALYGL
ncbi:MAG: hypothetical protein N838_05750 [Thiohalocapsa sp. PB-PSB1]|nr:MAG: hypothetical protein N838_05750 [Thiohalocapsa sp. PB-PSB1]